MPKGKGKRDAKFTPVFTLYPFQATVQSDGFATARAKNEDLSEEKTNPVLLSVKRNPGES